MMSTFPGYLIDVEWDGHTLRVHPRNRVAAMALLGERHADGDLVLTREQMAQVRHRPAGMLINGRVTIRTTEGRQHILHFRRRQRHDFAQLAAALGG